MNEITPTNLPLRISHHILYLLKRIKEGGYTTKEIIGDSSLSKAVVYNCANKGYIRRSGEGYVLAEKGRFYLDHEDVLVVTGEKIKIIPKKKATAKEARAVIPSKNNPANLSKIAHDTIEFVSELASQNERYREILLEVSKSVNELIKLKEVLDQSLNEER